MYRDGDGTKPDAAASLGWFRRAAEQGYVKAQSRLGQRLAHAEQARRNDQEAYLWSALAARKGASDAAGQLQMLKARMSPEQIAEAERRVAAWQPKCGP